MSLLAVFISVSAQKNDSTRISYSNITEFGDVNMRVISDIGFSLEVTSVHGFSIDKKHHIGLGMGIGFDFFSLGAYSPVFLNYRHCFTPDKTFSPHINVAFGGAMLGYDYLGMYSSITAGFIAGKFSFSSGFSLILYEDVFVHGAVIKCGFIF